MLIPRTGYGGALGFWVVLWVVTDALHEIVGPYISANDNITSGKWTITPGHMRSLSREFFNFGETKKILVGPENSPNHH